MALSFLSAGVGHIYCGRIGKGLLLYSCWFIVFLLCFLSAWFPATTGVLFGLMLVPAAIVFAIYFYAAFDAFDTARRIDSSYELKDYNRSALYALLIAMQLVSPVAISVVMRVFVYEAFYLPARSMSPTFFPNDRVLVNKLRIRHKFPERGDVIVFRNPDPKPGTGRNWIKRVVALPGDQVVIKGRDVFVNGEELDRDLLPMESIESIREQLEGEVRVKREVFIEWQNGKPYKVMFDENPLGGAATNDFKTVVPPRSVFLLGDNRDRSKDSRDFGPIHVGDIIGHVDYLFYPAETWSRFGAVE